MSESGYAYYRLVFAISELSYVEFLNGLVDSLKNRSDDIKARIAQVLKNLWFSERMLNEVKADINFDEIDLTFPHFAEVTNFYKNQIMIARKLKSHI